MAVLWPSTKQADEPANITQQSLSEHLSSYHSYSWKSHDLPSLNQFRYEELPQALEQRKKDGNTFLEKDELAKLVEWKLKHGTYRPKLAALVASNSNEDVRSTTISAFAKYDLDKDTVLKAIKILSALKGIGPATASLIISCYDPIKVPFFSDELFRYTLWKRAPGQGWDRKIQYTTHEYRALHEEVKTLRERLEKETGETVTAVDVERVAYILGKAALERPGTDKEDGKHEESVKPQKSSKKRKAATGESPNETKDAGKPVLTLFQKREDEVNVDPRTEKMGRRRPCKARKHENGGTKEDEEQETTEDKVISVQTPTQTRELDVNGENSIEVEMPVKPKRKRRG